ncbi:MAG TPA: class I SAM-dependent methyltransferase [Candidatus Paceibacterota bacterium]
MLENGAPLRQNEENRYLEILGLTWNELQGKRVLDIGAGSGSFARSAHHRGIQVISLDNSTKRWDAAHQDGFETSLVVADMARLSSEFEPESFDLVVSIASLYSENDAENTLPEVFTVLKPGGELRATVNYSQEFIESLSKRVGFSSRTLNKIAAPWNGFYVVLKK